MTDIVERLRFDAARCELQFSKGVARNIEEAAAEIERLTRRATLAESELSILDKNHTVLARRLARAGAALIRIRDFPYVGVKASHAIVSIAKDGLGDYEQKPDGNP